MTSRFKTQILYLTGMWTVAFGIVFGALGCKQQEKSAEAPNENVAPSKVMQEPGQKPENPPFGNDQDAQLAPSLWKTMDGYQENWGPFPGHEGRQEGKCPHGQFLRIYVNPAAKENTPDFKNGAVIVKENYREKEEDALLSITVMEKRKGYDPENEDWSWAKYDPNGEVMTNEQNTKLVSRVAKGTEQGCIACHASADDGDFVFNNDGPCASDFPSAGPHDANGYRRSPRRGFIFTRLRSGP